MFKKVSLVPVLQGLRTEILRLLSTKDVIRPYLDHLKSIITGFSPSNYHPSRKQKIFFLLFSGILSSLVVLYKLTRPPPRRLTFASFPNEPNFSDLYDVIVVGAGPSGSSCAYHLAKKGKKVLLLEKKSFPRDKYCGDAVTHAAQELLHEMGVLQGLLEENLAYSVDVGGFVSPCGNSFVGSYRSVMDHVPSPPSSTSSSAAPSPSPRPPSPRPPSPSPASSSTTGERPPSPRSPSPSPASADSMGTETYRGILTVKRVVLDERLAKAAQSSGAVLIENMNVLSAEFDLYLNTGTWAISCKKEQDGTHLFHSNSYSSFSGNMISADPNYAKNRLYDSFQNNQAQQTPTQEKIVFHSRALVCADGASSRLARSLGVVHSEPTAVCSRSYVQKPHAFKWDGMLFYPSSLLPGCCAIVRHANGDLGYLTFINPAMGGQAKEEDLSRLHHEFIKTDPYISQALGPFIYLERMKAASIRIGGVGSNFSPLNNFRTVSTSRTPTAKDRSYGDHLLVVGDAAGFVDPSTGLGIQYALEGGKIAAGVLVEGLYRKDLSVQFLQLYQKRWEDAFGNQFYWSLKAGQLLCRFPVLLDALAKLIQRKGDRFFAEWTQAMTGNRSKTWFLTPPVAPFLFIEIILELIRRQFRQR